MRSAHQLCALLTTTIALLLPVTAGCRAYAFDRDWRRAPHTPGPAAAGAPVGLWQGAWHSEGTGHSGRLRAIVDPPDPAAPAADATYAVRFDAVWGGLFRFGQTVRLPVTRPRPGAPLAFDSTHNAGTLGGGVYRFTGEISNTRITCRYEGKYDHGTFEMERSGR